MGATLKKYKRFGIYLLIIFPIFILLTYLFAKLKVPTWLAMFVNIIIGAILCFVFEIIFVKMQKRKQAKKELEPKRKDPFAD